MNIGTLPARHARYRGDHTALIFGDTRLSYRDFNAAINRLANAMLSDGIAKRDKVATILPYCIELMTLYWAAAKIGAVVVPSSTLLQAAGLKTLLVKSDCVCVFSTPAFAATLNAVRADAPAVGEGRWVLTGEGADGFRTFEDFVGDASDTEPPDAGIDGEDPYNIIYSSGTTGEPKGIVHTTAGFLLGSWANVQWQIGLEDDDIYWCATDVGWLTFPIHAIVGGPAHAATLLWYEGSIDFPDRERFYQIAARHKVTRILTAPTVLRMLRATGDEAVRRNPLPELRMISVQGEPLDGESFRWASKTLGRGDLPIINGYGQTETGSTWTYPVAGVDDIKAGSCGRPVPGHCCEIVDEAGQPVADGVKGTLVLTAPFPTLASTIWDDHERYLKTYFQRFPGRYFTADEAVRDQDGHLWVLGRADDVINVAAHRISTMEIESIAAAQSGVADAAVVGVNDAVKGTVPAAFLCLRPGEDVARVTAAVRKAVDAGIGGIARLEKVYICPALPKTRAGKTMRRLLREAAETGMVKGDTTGLDDPGTIDGVLAAVRSAA